MILRLHDTWGVFSKWDKYFLEQTPNIAKMSPDTSTKCGCILVKNRQIIGTGFNGNAKRIKDDLVPNTRPEKYFYKLHSEHNAILNATCPLDHSVTAYVTGLPCSNCTQLMYHVGIRRVLYSNYNNPKMCNEEDAKQTKDFLDLCLDPYHLIFIDKKDLE